MNGHFLLSIMHLVNDVHTCEIRYASSHAYCMHAAFKGDITGKKIKFPEENYNRTCKGHIFDEFPVSELYRTSHISLQIFFCAGQYCMSFTLPASGESIFSCSYCAMQELRM